MFFRRSKPESPTFESELAAVIQNAIPDADTETHAIVVAVAGLLGCISYADRDFSQEEKERSRKLLRTIHGISEHSAQLIVAALEKNIIRISTVEAPRYCRALVQLADRELRLEVLKMLLEIAAADEHIAQEEVVLLRQITKSLGLEQVEYNALQAEYKQLLSALSS